MSKVVYSISSALRMPISFWLNPHLGVLRSPFMNSTTSLLVMSSPHRVTSSSSVSSSSESSPSTAGAGVAAAVGAGAGVALGSYVVLAGVGLWVVEAS